MKVELLTKQKFFVVVPYIRNGKWDGINWITLTKIVFIINGKREEIPSGFVTDFASIPKFSRVTINRIGKAVMAFVIHDWLRTKEGQIMPTAACDMALYEFMILLGESWYTSNKVYYSLRCFGWTASVGKNRFVEVDDMVIKYICDSNNYVEKHTK